MSEVSHKKQLMVARQHLDKLAIFIVNMANFYQGANPSFDDELQMLKKQLSGKPNYDMAAEITGKLNANLKKDTKFFKQRNLDSVSHLQTALRKLSNIKSVPDDVRSDVSLFLSSLSPDKNAVVAPLAQFEKALSLYNRAIQNSAEASAKPTPEQLALHDSITQELKELIAPFYIGNKKDKNLENIYRKLNAGIDHKELLECCLILIRFVIRDVIKEASATSRLVTNLHKSLGKISESIKSTISDSVKRQTERDNYNSEINAQINTMENVVADSKQLDELKLQAQEHLDHLQSSLTKSADAEKREQAATIALMKKMQERVNELEAEAATYKQKLFTQRAAALSDQLTKLPNRMAYEEKAPMDVANAKKRGETLSIGIMDIDHFKKINDTYGHTVGDKTLQVIAKHIREFLPNEDFVARWGGEEFVILMPNTNKQLAFDKVEVIRKKIATLPFKFKGERVSVTVSCGLAEITAKNTLETAFEKADANLYKAKEQGRNRTINKDSA
ncbi:diguanylate cyclase [Glaciecola sp. MH2013]|uniref:GGDEF domain-containing protein n=1 Tax=Glaciecola sp. MH2013 TaxID=2785524 RepID=UPI00189D301F|nr:GGDEF domain-containing protein [Glaciecola sp. MH2013]MBF7072255.1 diguanylate cyclase [Glaciecola sp. MH2013]